MNVKLFAHISENNLTRISREDLADAGKVAPLLSFYRSDMSKYGDVLVGTVEVDVELLPPDQIVGNAIVALRAKAAEIRAKASAEVAQLEGKAQQLLAIEYTPT